MFVGSIFVCMRPMGKTAREKCISDYLSFIFLFGGVCDSCKHVRPESFGPVTRESATIFVKPWLGWGNGCLLPSICPDFTAKENR